MAPPLAICDRFFRSILEAFLTRDDPSAFAAPAHFGPFRVLHQIGVGALGPVFRTYEPERDRLVAVKVFRLDITPEQAQTLADELLPAAEAGLFHPSIVEPIAAGVEGSVAYRAEEYVAAESLDVAMRHYAPAPLNTVLPFITQLGGAIDFARAAGVGHGALHPRDIFVTPEEARATGFGVVEALERVGLRAPIRRPYTAPERIAGDRWHTPADVFSLAAISYELLTGRRPAGLGSEIGPLTSGTPNEWMDALHSVLARAMSEKATDRYPTALAFASALELAGRGQVETARPTAVAPPPAADPAINPVVATAATAAVPVITPVSTDRPLTDGRHEAVTGHESVMGARGTTEPDEDDIAAERDEDDAHHQLMLDEDVEHTEIRRGPDLDLDEDIAAEAEADRFVGDDFLLEAAGAATAHPLDADPYTADPLDRRALDDDEVMVDERPSALFHPEDLLHSDADRTGRTQPPVSTPAAAFPASAASSLRRDEPTIQRERRDEPAYQVAPYGAMEDVSPSDSKSGWPLALTFAILGLLAGFGGGYAYRGRSTPEPAAAPAATASTAKPPAPVGREFSEQTVTPPATPPRRATTSTPAGTPTQLPPAKPGASPSVTPPPAAKPPSMPSSASAAANTGSIVVRSTPSGAGVTVNGRWRGRTPLRLSGLALIRYEVRVVQPGYASSREIVTLSAGEPSRALSVRLDPQAAAPPRPGAAAPPPSAGPQIFTGSLYVDSRPRGARVSVDGKPVGVTPLRVPEVRIGTHVVRLELPDHRIWSTTATITAGQEQRVTGSLERIQ